MTESIIFLGIEVVTVVFNILIVHTYIDGFFTANDRNKNARILSYAIFGLLLTLANILKLDMVLLLAITFASILLIEVIFYKGQILFQCFAALAFCVLAIIAESLGAIFIARFASIDLQRVIEYGFFRVAGSILSQLMLLLIVKIVVIVINKLGDPLNRRIWQIAPLLICQVFSLFYVGNSFLLIYRAEEALTIYTFIDMTGILYINAVIFWYFDRIVTSHRLRREKEVAEIKLEGQLRYYALVRTQKEHVDAIHHDISKHINIMKQMLNNGLKDEASEYLSSFTDSIKRYSDVVVAEDPVINAILNDGINRAVTNGIRPKLDIFLSEEICIDPVDLTVIIGNTVDNAIDALNQLEAGKERWLNITLRQSDAFLFYEIQNPYSQSQTRSPRKNREEYGLRNVKSSVQRYGGQTHQIKDSEVFKVTIIIPLTEK